MGSALAKGHIQGVFDQFASQVVGHGPADDAATEGVYHHREVEEARMGRHIGDIGYPQPVPGRSAEVPVDQVRRLPAFFGSPGSAHGSAARYPADRGHAHQAGNAFSSCAYARRAVRHGCAARRRYRRSVDGSSESGSPGDGSPEPDVVAAGGDIQQTAHPANGIGGLMRLYEREAPGSSLGLPGEPGRGFCQDLPIHPELSVLTAQTTQFGPFFGSQAVFTPALIQVVLFDPVADGLRGGLELLGQCFSGCGRSERDRPSAGGRPLDRGHGIWACGSPFIHKKLHVH